MAPPRRPLLGALLALAARSLADVTLPAPISLEPSTSWYGDDGQWNTFELAIGTPPQYVQLLASISSQQTIAIIDQACQGSSQYEACATSRGGLYTTSNSSTYTEFGIYSFEVPNNLNIISNAQFGYDTIALTSASDASFSLDNTTVGGTAAYTYYLGILGLSTQRTDYANGPQNVPSIIDQLKTATLIPSLSFGYTAGARYRIDSVLGSLTLGGVDRSRYVSNDVVFSFSGATDRPLILQLDNITATSSSSPLSSSSITVALDSSVSEFYLPTSVCDSFANAFNLTYDESSGLYFVSNETRTNLLDQSPNITFTISPSSSAGASVSITLPYSAFDLEALPPYQNLSSSQRFFPIRRANSADEYTIGRTFLQEAYLSVDWERSQFNISQTVTEVGSESEIMLIYPVDTTPFTSKNDSLSAGAIAGIVVGVVIGVLLVISVILFFLIRRRRARNAAFQAKKDSLDDSNNVFPKAELDADDTGIEQGSAVYGKRGAYSELASQRGGDGPPVEVENHQLELFEMPGDVPKRAEMPDPSQMQMSEKEAAVEREKVYNGVNPHSPTAL